MESMQRAPTMNINQSDTAISKVDPLKRIFRSLFDTLPDSARGHVVAFLGELIGTISFLFFAFAGGQSGAAASNDPEDGGQAENVSTQPPGLSPQLLLYISLAAGFSLVVHAWIFFRISGGLFNPVISFGMALIGAITWARCGLLIIAQTVGAFAATYMVKGLFNGGLNVSTHLGGDTSPAQGVIIEMLLTALVAFTIFMLAAEQHAGTYLAPIGIGLSLFVAQIVGLFWTGASLNPVRSLAPCVATGSFPEYHWVYWVGPIAGTILAVLLFKLVKALEYETVAHDAHRDSLVVHVDNKEPLTAPLTSVSPAAPQRKPSMISTQTIQVGRPSEASKPAPPPKTPKTVEKQDEKKDNKEEKEAVFLPLADPGYNMTTVPPRQGPREQEIEQRDGIDSSAGSVGVELEKVSRHRTDSWLSLQ